MKAWLNSLTKFFRLRKKNLWPEPMLIRGYNLDEMTVTLPVPAAYKEIPIMLWNKSKKENVIVQSAEDESGITFINNCMRFVIRPKQAVFFVSDGKNWYTQSSKEKINGGTK